MTARRMGRRLARSARGVEVAVSLGLARRGPCALCGCGLDALHRIVDAIRGRRGAGDSAEDLARDFEVSPSVVHALTGRPSVHA